MKSSPARKAKDPHRNHDNKRKRDDDFRDNINVTYYRESRYGSGNMWGAAETHASCSGTGCKECAGMGFIVTLGITPPKSAHEEILRCDLFLAGHSMGYL